MNEDYVLFPCASDKWNDVKVCLESLLTYPPDSGDVLVEKLQYMYNLIQKHQAKSDVFIGLKKYLSNTEWNKREMFVTKTLPAIVQHCLDIEIHKPAEGLAYSKQHQECTVTIENGLAASIVACSFLCLWPGRRFDRHSLLNSINFDDFYQPCISDSGQCAKLECILHYFEQIAVNPEDLDGNVVFHRQVLKSTEVLNISDWTKSIQPLCPISVHTAERIEDAGPNILQVDFANRKLGGAVLGRGKVQEEIRFSICPQLIAGMLFMEAMTEQEAIIVQGFKNYSDYTGYSRGLLFSGTFPETAQRDCLGNFENYLCAIDALSFKRLGGPDEQYKLKNVVRELNKAYIGFNQKFLKHSAVDPLSGEYQGQEEGSSMSNVVESYFTTLSEEIFTTALQETLVSLHESSSSSTNTSHSSGQNGRTVHDPLDLVSASVDYARRRSSNLSDLSSRRSSSAGSRRSSGTPHTSSECGSELEEYFQSYQARHNLKPSVIKEETGENEFQDFASQILKNIFSEGVQKAKDMTPNIKDFCTQAPSSAVVKPKALSSFPVIIDRNQMSGGQENSKPPNVHILAHHPKALKSGRHRSPLRWKEPVDDEHVAPESVPSSNTHKLASDNSILLTERNLSADVQLNSQANRNGEIESFSQDLTECIMYEALRDLSEIHLEPQRLQTVSKATSSSAKRVAGYIGGMIKDVWSHSAYNVRKHFKTQQEQQMWTSDTSIDLDLDLKIYADDFVEKVLQEAVDVYRNEKRVEQIDLESGWQKALEKFKTDAKYFEAEFGRYAKQNASHHRNGRYLYTKSRIQREMLRRRSLDETGRCLLGSVSGYKDLSLSSFEKELIKSASSMGSKGPMLSCFEKELLNVNPTSVEMFFYSGVRRSSEPAPTHCLSIDVGCPPSHLKFSDRRRGSSACSASSRELILDWLNQSQRSSGSSNGGSRHRTRTTSSHLDWYAQDLLLEAFNDALKEIFGDVHMISVDTDSVNNSFSSSHSAAAADNVCTSQSAGTSHISSPMGKPFTNNAEICDTYLPIPSSSSGSISNNNNTNSVNNLAENHTNKEDYSYISSSSPMKKLVSNENASVNADIPIKTNYKTTEEFGRELFFNSGAQLSSTPTESVQISTDLRAQYESMGARPKMVMSSGRQRQEANKFQDTHKRDDIKVVALDVERIERISPTSTGSVVMLPSMSYEMMSGLCENLSNEVIEGARSSLTSRNLPSQNVSIESLPIQPMPVATGNWGCGAYRGNPQLKALIQWMAASCQNVPEVHYYTFADQNVTQLDVTTILIMDHNLTVGDLLKLVLQYCEELHTGQQLTLFQYIQNRLS